MMTRRQFADAFKRTVYMKGVDASLARLRPDEELVIASRVWVIFAGESTAEVDFETFGKFVLEAPTLEGVQVRQCCHAETCDHSLCNCHVTPRPPEASFRRCRRRAAVQTGTRVLQECGSVL